MRFVSLLAAAAVLFGATASAQSALNVNVPPWARELLSADFDTINGGRPTLVGLSTDLAVRVTIVPREGGVARVIRYEQTGEEASIALRRLTGHPQQGWWLWGPDTPAYLTVDASEQTELTRLARSALGVARITGQTEDPDAPCATGQAVYVEVAQRGNTPFTATRSCVGTDPVSELALRLSGLAGSQDEASLDASAIAELLAQDRAFAQAARDQGIQAAFQAFAREDAIVLAAGRQPLEGTAGISSRFSGLPAGARLVWEPRFARVSTRGEMGWTWGEGLLILPNGETSTSWYVTIWQRDLDGVWKWVLDIGTDGPPDPSQVLLERAAQD
jgi:ketosteroid isomerase-like protein